MSKAPDTKAGRGRRRARARGPITDRQGRIRCEVCKRFFHALASHVRVHDLDAETYRASYGSVCFWSVPTRRRVARWHRHPIKGSALPFPQDAEDLLEVLQEASHRGSYPATARLREMARVHFGSWAAAMEAAGHAGALYRRWTKTAVLDALLQYVSGGGVPQHARLMEADAGLWHAALRFFGRTADAFRAAGIEPVDKSRVWDRPRIVEHLRQRQAAGRSLRQHVVRREDLPLFGAAEYHFGSWRAAMRAAGLALELGWQKVPERTLLRRIRQVARQDPRIPRVMAGRIRRIGWSRYGSWPRALAAAGVTREDLPTDDLGRVRCRACGKLQVDVLLHGTDAHGLSHAAYVARYGRLPRRTWTDAGVLAALRFYAARGVAFDAVWRTNASLTNAARARFGSLRAAIRAAETATVVR